MGWSREKRWMKTALVQFGVLPTGSKVITSAATGYTRDTQRSNHPSDSYFFYRLSYCLALVTEMIQATLEAFPL